MKPTILFVDDEPNILNGLQRFFRVRRNEWTMIFAAGGDEALGILREKTAESPVEMIVTDMRMPGTDGAALLEWISQNQPGIVRIVLSGEADIEATYRIIGRSHRFLAKPCAPETLNAAIDEILTQRSPDFHNWNGQGASFLDNLLIAPQVHEAFDAYLSTQEASVDGAADIIAADPAFSARILQLSNSAYFGRPLSTCSIERSVSAIGIDRLRELSKRNRFGKPADISGSKSPPIDYSILARTMKIRGSEFTSDREILDTIYATGLLMSLGSITSNVNPRKTSAYASYAATLLGLPQPLTSALKRISQEERPNDEKDFIDGICNAVMAVFRLIA